MRFDGGYEDSQGYDDAHFREMFDRSFENLSERISDRIMGLVTERVGALERRLAKIESRAQWSQIEKVLSLIERDLDNSEPGRKPVLSEDFQEFSRLTWDCLSHFRDNVLYSELPKIRTRLDAIEGKWSPSE